MGCQSDGGLGGGEEKAELRGDEVAGQRRASDAFFQHEAVVNRCD